MMRCHAEEEAYAAEAHAAVTGLRVLMIARPRYGLLPDSCIKLAKTALG